MNNLIEHPHQIEQAAPLSFAQQRLWLLDRLMPTGSVYNIDHVLRISGELDPAALREALNELVRRHEVLRTRFGMQDGQPVQVIAPEVRIALVIEDLRECAPDERANEAQRRAQAESEAPFDLTNGPLIRARLLRLTPSEHWLLLTLHHIVTDGWSSGVLRRELTTLYNAYHRGEPSPLPTLSVQYADYALWQRQWLQGPVLEKQLGFWRQALSDLPTLDLPTDRPRPAAASYRGACVNFEVPESLTRSLKDLSRREGVTLFMTLLATYQILLFRHSGQEDVAVGVPIAGRTRLELEGLIGFFVNTLVLRGDLSGEPSFKTYLARVRVSALDAYEHQDLPFEKLVEELAPKRDLSRNPLFQASLVLQNTPSERWQLSGLDVRRVEGVRSTTAKFDLTMGLTESEGRLMGSLEYATDLFEAATIERMVGHFVCVLEGIVADPECRIAELPLLTAAERHQLLMEWNDTAVDYPRDQTLHRLFEQQVERTPEATAVVFGEQQLTYHELNARANQLAHHLRTLGVGPEMLVGLCLKRSLELMVGLLGILKAGGAYVPLDPSYPAHRLAFMLEDTRAPVLLTQQGLLGQLPPHAGRTLCLDRDWPIVAAQPATNPSSLASATNLAYVIYTSGSTGEPKGVCITHRGLMNYLSWATKAYSVTAGTGAPVHSSMAFDLTVTSLFAPILTGRTVELLPEGPGVDALATSLQASGGYSLVKLTPAQLELLAAQMPPESAKGRTRAFVIGGEQLRAETLSFWRKHAPNTRLVNEYGPTETVVGCCIHAVTDETPATGVVPIGRPIANTRLYALSEAMDPVPVGVAGELYIGGDGLARGYWNRPELTAERFVPDPFSAHPGARLYRTGDRVRYLPDGNLEFLGRLDTQVKLRGFRIELGEIEAVLSKHPAVREAVVLLREDVPGGQRLVAYVVARGDAIAAADLRTALKQTLPDYMIPAAFVHLPALPLTPNGKIDRKSLPVPGSESLVAEDGFVAPHDAIEVQLVRIWEALLGHYPVGVKDDFFDLGGHSLLVMQVVDRVKQLFGRDLPADVLWHGGRTIETLAAILRDDTKESDPIWSHAVPIRPNGKRRPLFCAPVDGGHLFFYDNLARHLDPDQPVYGLPAQGTDGRQPPHTTIEAMAAHAIRLMREVQPAGPYALLGYCSGGTVAFEMARQLEAQGESAALLALIDSSAPAFSLRSWGNLLFPANRSRDWRMLQERIYQVVLHPLGLGRLRRFAKIGEAHRWALWSYRPARLAGRVVIIRGFDSTHPRDPALGWDRFVAGGVEVTVLPGRRGDLVKGPGAARLADELVKWLA